MTIWIPTLDRAKPLYLAIADAMAQDVEAGILSRGSRLPPQRDLAWKLGVTLGTVTRAYREAETRGLLSGEVGRGSFIRSGAQVPPINGLPSDQSETIDLSHAIPPPVITTQEFDQALAAIMRDPKKLGLLDYAPLEGFQQHRAMAVQWLKRSSMEVTERDCFIVAGAQLGLIVALQALAEPGEKVMAETVNYASLGSVFKSAYLEPLCIGRDADGLRPDEFERAAKAKLSRFVYLVPSIQNPTTHTMSRKRRDEIVSIARKYDVTIIEDDIFRLLDDRVQPPTFYALAPERVVHITSLSKTLGPGLRIGIVVTPQGQDKLLRNHLRALGPRSAGLTAEIARYWITSGKADDILARTRIELARRRAVFLEVFKDRNVACEPGSPFAWMELPEDWTGNRFAAACRAQRIHITPGSAFDLSNGRNADRHVRICFGSPQNAWRPLPSFQMIRGIMDQGEDDEFTPVA